MRSSAGKAKKALGQNFLYDENYIAKIVAAVQASPDDTIIEIGPGRGALTEKLVDSGADVIAIELDRDLIGPLRIKFANRPNFRVIEQDALTVDLGRLLSENMSVSKAKLVANLPYYISTPILQHLAEQRDQLSELVLMFQREVVDRLAARPGSSDRGFLTVLTESAFDIERLFDVPPAAFRPVPKVWSSVVKLFPKERTGGEASLRRLISAAFAQKRKTIANNLKTFSPNYAEILAAAQIDPIRRAESLTLEEWLRLNEAVAQSK